MKAKTNLTWLDRACPAILLVALGTSALAAETANSMPDPLVFDAGGKVEKPDEWPLRREEMKRIIEHDAIGRMPPAPGNVKGMAVDGNSVMNDLARYQRVHLTFGPLDSLALDVALFTPAGTGRFPVIVFPSFKALPAPGEAADEFARQFEAPLRRGYCVATFFYQQCAADVPDGRQSGFFPAFPDYDWGTIAAWAWGMSRCVDYLESQPFVDRKKFLAVGHSRLGKAALVAGAWDERFSLAAPAGSGCGGTGAYRFCGKERGGKEGLEDVVKRFPQWFVPRLAEYSGRVEKLPFDQHWLIALVAPRLFIAADGLDDPYANGNALAQSWLAAKPSYQMLGVADHLAIHFRPGKHLLAPDDWQVILDFSDQQLRRKEITRQFNELPAPGKLH